MSGKGKMIDVNGEIFEGEYKNGKKDGQGVVTKIDSRKYLVEYKDGE